MKLGMSKLYRFEFYKCITRHLKQGLALSGSSILSTVVLFKYVVNLSVTLLNRQAL